MSFHAYITVERQWWILGEANEAATLGPLFGVVEGPPFAVGVCSFRIFCGILKWVLGLNNCGGDN